VHLNLPWPVYGLPYLLTCALLRRPAVVVFHAVRDGLSAGRARPAYRWAQRRNQVWVVVADHQRGKLAATLGVPVRRIGRIYNGVADIEVPTAARRAELRTLAGLAPDDFVVASVGRLTENKCHIDLIQAVALLRDDLPRLRALIVGDGRTRGALQARIEALGVAGMVCLTGERADVHDTLAMTDVFAFPSRAEGFPIALLEAMAAGCAIVATDFEGVEELLDDGVSGVIVPAGRPRCLAAAISELARQPDLRHRLATGARSRAAHFSRESMLQQTLDVYERLRRQRPRPGDGELTWRR